MRILRPLKKTSPVVMPAEAGTGMTRRGGSRTAPAIKGDSRIAPTMNCLPGANSLVFILPLISLTLLLTGCRNDRYAIERKHWHLQKEASAVLRAPELAVPGEWERITGEFRAFSAKYPLSPQAINADFTLTRLYLARGAGTDARKHLAVMLKKYRLSPHNVSEILFLMGTSYEREKKWNQALMYYQKIKSECPQTLKGFILPLYIAHHYRQEQQHARMEEAYREAITFYSDQAKKFPNKPVGYKAQLLTAQCYTEINDWANAAGALESTAGIYRGKVNLESVLMDLASIYWYELKDKDKAQRTIDRLLTEYPGSRLSSAAGELRKKIQNNGN